METPFFSQIRSYNNIIRIKKDKCNFCIYKYIVCCTSRLSHTSHYKIQFCFSFYRKNLFKIIFRKEYAEFENVVYFNLNFCRIQFHYLKTTFLKINHTNVVAVKKRKLSGKNCAVKTM